MAERMIEVNGVELCTQSFGDPDDPPVLLVMGIGGSMLWWEEGFCRMLADGGRLVIRYDHRDTGRSVSYEPGQPGYTGSDLVDDAVGVLGAYGLTAAHLVGVSAGGAFAQLAALRFASRVLSLVLISTSPATSGERSLPSPTGAFLRFVASAEVDWDEPESVVEYLVEYARVLAGDQRPFDEAACRRLVRRDVERTRNIAALQNHDAIPDDEQANGALSAISAATLVIHGTADPMFPLEHGEALAAEIPRAQLLRLPKAGHGVDRADWETIARAIVAHTANHAVGAIRLVEVVDDVVDVVRLLAVGLAAPLAARRGEEVAAVDVDGAGELGRRIAHGVDGVVAEQGDVPRPKVLAAGDSERVTRAAEEAVVLAAGVDADGGPSDGRGGRSSCAAPRPR